MRNCNNLYMMLVYTRKLTLAKSFHRVFINIVIKVTIILDIKTAIAPIINNKAMTLLSHSHVYANTLDIILDR